MYCMVLGSVPPARCSGDIWVRYFRLRVCESVLELNCRKFRIFVVEHVCVAEFELGGWMGGGHVRGFPLLRVFVGLRECVGSVCCKVTDLRVLEVWSRPSGEEGWRGWGIVGGGLEVMWLLFPRVSEFEVWL